MNMLLQGTVRKKSDYHHYLIGGILASVSASICCLEPFALLATGMSGAWISNLMVVEPYQPFLIGLTVVSFLFAATKVFIPAEQVTEKDCCKGSAPSGKQKWAFSVCSGLALLFVTSEYWVTVLA